MAESTFWSLTNMSRGQKPRRKNTSLCFMHCVLVHRFANTKHHGPPDESTADAIAYVMACTSQHCKCNKARAALHSGAPEIYVAALDAIATVKTAPSEPMVNA